MTSTDANRLPLEGATRVVVCFDPLRITTETGDAAAYNPGARARFTIARLTSGVWRWRWDPMLYAGSLYVNGGTVVDGEPFVDGDQLRYVAAYGGQIDAVVELEATSKVPCLVVARDRSFTPPSNWNALFSAGDALASARVLGRWLTFVGPGTRRRAIPVHGSVRRPLFVVPGITVDEGIVVDDLPDQRVVIEQRGICTLAELVDVSLQQGATIDHTVVIDLVLRAMARSARRFPVQGIEIDVDGTINVLHDFPSSHTAIDAARTIAALVCVNPRASAQTIVDAMPQSFDPMKREPLRRTLALANDMGVRSFHTELGALDIVRPPPEELGNIVRAQFPERARFERELEEQLAALDQRGIDALVQRARDLQL